ncbi:HAD hydrolase family protein, partial [Brevibacterium otitidis]
GDMPNDIEMLTWAGWGYAMADGHPTTLAAARAVAPAVHDGGITEAIRAFAAAAQRRNDGGSGEIVRISD